MAGYIGQGFKFTPIGTHLVLPCETGLDDLCAFVVMLEVICNDRLGKKVRVKCKYPFLLDRAWEWEGRR